MSRELVTNKIKKGIADREERSPADDDHGNEIYFHLIIVISYSWYFFIVLCNIALISYD